LYSLVALGYHECLLAFQNYHVLVYVGLLCSLVSLGFHECLLAFLNRYGLVFVGDLC
jgi:hypothetical protein